MEAVPRKPRPGTPLRRGSFRRRLTSVMVGLVALVAALIGAAHALQLNNQITENTQAKALTLARAVAAQPGVRAEVARISAGGAPAAADLQDGPLQQTAQAVTERSGALFVVITDEEGIRLSHPDPARLGQRVSTDPGVALGGQEETTGNTGTLGPSAGAKVPIFAQDGTVVGEVSVGFEQQDLARQWLLDARWGLAAAVLAAGVGAAAAMVLSRRLHRQILGLEPSEIAAMATEQEAVLHGVDEGVIGVDPDLIVRVANRAAREMLPLVALDEPADAARLPAELVEMLSQARASSEGALPAGGTPPDGAGPRTVVAGERVLVCTVRPVRRQRADLGFAVVVRDRTHVQTISRELADARALTSALRIQRHEFSNRLHTIAGLIDVGAAQEAADYVRALTKTSRLGSGIAGLEAVADERLRSFLSVKAAQAHEKSVSLRLSEESSVRSLLSGQAALQDVATILGNLIDNATRAALAGGSTTPAVLVDLVDHEGALHLAVTDTGAGFTDPERAFELGYSELPGADPETGGHGIGLHLARRIARARGGDAWIGSARGSLEWSGATVCARLPGVLSRGTPLPDAS